MALIFLQDGAREKSKSLTAISSSVANKSANKYKWLEWDDKSLLGKCNCFNMY